MSQPCVILIEAKHRTGPFGVTRAPQEIIPFEESSPVSGWAEDSQSYSAVEVGVGPQRGFFANSGGRTCPRLVQPGHPGVAKIHEFPQVTVHLFRRSG